MCAGLVVFVLLVALSFEANTSLDEPTIVENVKSKKLDFEEQQKKKDAVHTPPTPTPTPIPTPTPPTPIETPSPTSTAPKPSPNRQHLFSDPSISPPFSSLSTMFTSINSSPTLKYVLCKNMKFSTAASGRHQSTKGQVITTRDYSNLVNPKNVASINDVDILVSSIADFTSASGAVRKPVTPTGSHMSLQISGVEVIFDLHYVGDNFVDSKWEKDIVERGVLEVVGEGDWKSGIYVPAPADEFMLTLHHMIVRKSNPLKSEYLSDLRIAMGKVDDLGEENIASEEKMWSTLRGFMDKHGYVFAQPLDPNIGFNPTTSYKKKTI